MSVTRLTAPRATTLLPMASQVRRRAPMGMAPDLRSTVDRYTRLLPAVRDRCGRRGVVDRGQPVGVLDRAQDGVVVDVFGVVAQLHVLSDEDREDLVD